MTPWLQWRVSELSATRVTRVERIGIHDTQVCFRMPSSQQDPGSSKRTSAPASRGQSVSLRTRTQSSARDPQGTGWVLHLHAAEGQARGLHHLSGERLVAGVAGLHPARLHTAVSDHLSETGRGRKQRQIPCTYFKLKTLVLNQFLIIYMHFPAPGKGGLHPGALVWARPLSLWGGLEGLLPTLPGPHLRQPS